MNSVPVRFFHAFVSGLLTVVCITLLWFHMRQGFVRNEKISPPVAEEEPILPNVRNEFRSAASDDWDGDGIPNAWETANCLDPGNAADGLSDFDHDGLTAKQEYDLSISTAGALGNHLGTNALSDIGAPGGFSVISTLTLVEASSNGLALVQVRGKPVGESSYRYRNYVYDPSTGIWRFVAPPDGVAASVMVNVTDVNSRGQVVGWYNSGGAKGFIWTPDPVYPYGGTSELFYIDPGSLSPVAAIPKRISDTGYILYSLGSPSALLQAATPNRLPVEPITGAWSTPYYTDVNDCGEFVGIIADPVTWRITTFLAIPNGPVFCSSPEAYDYNEVFDNYFSDYVSHSLNAPVVDLDSIVWSDPDPYEDAIYGTAIDQETQEVVEFKQDNRNKIWWKWIEYFPGGASEVHWVTFNSEETLACVNDWGEFAGHFTQTTEETVDFYGGGTGSSSWGGQGVFWFDGEYHMTVACPAVYGISNDPRILLGTTKPTHLWSDGVLAPLSRVAAVPSSTSKIKLAEDGVMYLQVDSKTVRLLTPADDPDSDGMPTDWEVYYGLDPAAHDAHLDADGDGKNNLQEFRLRENPAGPAGVRNGIDSDGDGMPNPWEVFHGLDHLDPSDADEDPDSDGLTNLEEYRLRADPNSPDSDGDGLPDGWEAAHGLDPTDNGSGNPVNGAYGDVDKDGSTNASEHEKNTSASDPEDHPVQIAWIETVAEGNYSGPTPEGNYIGQCKLWQWGKEDYVRTTETTVAVNRNYLLDKLSDVETAPETPDGLPKVGVADFEGSSAGVTDGRTFHIAVSGSASSGAVARHRYWIKAPPQPYERSFKLIKTKRTTIRNLAAGQSTNFTETDPVVEVVEFTIPANAKISNPLDVENAPSPAVGYLNDDLISLLPVELDIEYGSQEGIKELEEAKEDTGDGGYISLKSQTHQGEDITPTTYLVIRPTTGLPDDSKVRLRFNSGGRYKVARDRLGSDPVISESTEFPAGQETRLYLVGETKSQSRGGEQITMQIKAGGSWVDGDSLKATVVQTQFQIDLRVFIPYNWVNIPLHPSVAGGDNRSYDPNLNGTYRVSQKAILNLYKEWVPDVESRMIDDGKSAGITYHYSTSDVTNFNSGAKHSEDTTVKPSYVNSGASPSNSGIADLSGVESTVISALSDDKQVAIKFEGEAAEPILPVAAPINWLFRVITSKDDPLSPTFAIVGEHDGFPAYEVYINSKHPIFPYTSVLQWKPPLTSDVWELVGDMDVSVISSGNINQ